MIVTPVIAAVRRFIWRLLATLCLRRPDDGFDAELESHLQLHIDDNLRAGMSPGEARRHALLRLGGLESTRQAWRQQRSLPSIEHVIQDARFAVRQLARAPGFTATAIGVLALGLGASLAIFAIVDAALVRPLPYHAPDRLVEVRENTPQIPLAALSYPDFVDWRRLTTVFSALEVHAGRGFALRTDTGTLLLPGARVSAGFFRALGVTPMFGRDFHPDEDLAGAPKVALLSHSAWQQRFGGDRGVTGRTITLDTEPYTVIGVLPPGFAFASEGQAEIWTPLQSTGPCEQRRSCHFLIGIGRLEDGVALDAALAETTMIARQLETQYPDSNRGQGATLRPLAEATVGELRPILIVLLSGASLLLLIALANVASLLLVRAEGRRREMAVRGAIGASRTRLAQQFITEALVLVLLGGALGLLAAHWGLQMLLALVPADLFARMPYLGGLGMNAHVFIAAGAVGALALIVLSAAPLLRVSLAAHDGLNESARGTAGRAWRRLGFRLVVVELAMAMVLLATAGLLGKSFYRLLNVELGFEPAPLAAVRVAAPPAKYGTDAARVALWRQVLGRTEALPGVESAALASVVPVSFNGNTDWIRFVGGPYNGEHNEVNQRDVSGEYFTTIGAIIRGGRGFTAVDRAGAAKVAVVNRAFVRLYFADREPLGARFGDTALSPDSIKTIVGVVDDIREGALDSEIWPAVYYPFEQDPGSSYFLVVRTAQAPGSVLPLLVATVWGIDPDVGTVGPIAMADRISQSPVAHLRRSSMWLVGGFAGLAVLLGAVGLFGVIAYSVGQRTREIGVRLAMGAPRASVYRLVLGDAARVTALGISIGLAAAIAAAQLMRALLFDTRPWDLPTLTGVAVVLVLAAFVASYVPARRAASVNPIDALRCD